MTVMTILKGGPRTLYQHLGSQGTVPGQSSYSVEWYATNATSGFGNLEAYSGTELEAEFDGSGGCRYDGRWLVWMLRNVGSDDARGDSLTCRGAALKLDEMTSALMGGVGRGV
jgi:hypothetical protein